MTRHLFGPDGRRKLTALASRRLVLVLDFDGTLCPIVEDRARARMASSTRRCLAVLARSCPVVVVSGRARADVASRLAGLPLAGIVGNHGAEEATGTPPPGVRRWRGSLKRDLAHLAGVEVEDKGYSLSVHFRRAPRRQDAHRAIRAVVDRLRGARAVEGHAVVNVVPAGAPHKGSAVRKWRRRLGTDAVIYVGDDVTDEDAFALGGPSLLAVRVGSSRRTAASHHLRDQSEIERLLCELARLRRGSRSGAWGLPVAALAALAALPGCRRDEPSPVREQPVVTSAVPESSGPEDPLERAPLNVLLILIDSLRADVSWTGYPRETTPRVDAFRREHCVAYSNGYALSSYTAKSVVPALVGEYPSAMPRDAYFFTRYSDSGNLFVSERAHGAGHRTLSLQAHGYFLPTFLTHQGFDVRRTLPGGVDLHEVTSVTSERLTKLAIEVLGKPENTSPGPGKRFFAFTQYMDPHHTYEAHVGFRRFGRQARGLYDHEVLYTDHWVGELLEFAKKQPWWRDTAVILSSDHGESFGERKHNRHGHELWESVIRVPWLVCVPGAKPRIIGGVRRSHIDLAPTIADLMLLPGEPAFRGRSLVPEVMGLEPAGPRRVVADQPRSDLMDRRRAVIDGDWKVVAFGDDRAFALFDLAADPWEKEDLASARPEKLEAMKRIYFEESGKIPLVETSFGPDLKGAPRGRRW